MVSHDDNLGDDLLASSGNATQQFWDSRYGLNDYIHKRAFYEPVGNRQYQQLQIYNKWPTWKLMMIFTVVSLIIVIIIGVILDLSVGLVILICVFGAIALCVIYQMKCGDVAAQRQSKRKSRRDYSQRGQCGGACGAGCGGVIYYGDGYDGGCG